MVDLHDQIVKRVVAPKPVAGNVSIETDRMVIPTVRWILAPGISFPDRAYREARFGTGHAIGAPPDPQRVKRALWRRPIAFALINRDA